MKNILKDLYNHKIMTKEEAKNVLFSLTDGSANNSQIASFLTIFLMREITVEELDGFKEAMIEMALKLDIDNENLIDLCGTGGDGKDTFNISTVSSFVVAGAGIKVSKHGNYGVSSSCGSSNIISHFGHTFTNKIENVNMSLEKANFCFLHAPLFHPSLKNVLFKWDPKTTFSQNIVNQVGSDSISFELSRTINGNDEHPFHIVVNIFLHYNILI